MQGQLSIRDNLAADADAFTPARVVDFSAGDELRVGSNDQCECVVSDPALAPVHFALTPAENGDTEAEWCVVPREEAVDCPGTSPAPEDTQASPLPLFLNGQVVDGTTRLRSGDLLRVGHWTFLFHKTAIPGEFRRRRDHSAHVARLLVLTVLTLEILALVWLPRQLRASELLKSGRLRHRTVLLIDQTRNELNKRSPADDPMREQAYQLLSRELRHLTNYLQRHGDRLKEPQWGEIRRAVVGLQRIKTRLDHGMAIPDLPRLNMEKATAAILKDRKSD